MTDYYVVATGVSDNANTYSTTSGGSAPAGPPTYADNIICDANSGAVTLTMALFGSYNSIICTGFTGTVVGGSYYTIYISDDLTWGSGMTLTAATTTFEMLGSGSHTITSAGKSFGKLRLNGTGTFTLQDALAANLLLSKGTFASAGYSITSPLLESGGSNTRTLDIQGSTVALTENAAGHALSLTSTGLTVIANASTTIETTSYANIVDCGGVDLSDVEWIRLKSQYGTNQPQILGDGSHIKELKLNSLGGQFFLDCNLTIDTLTKHAGTPKLIFTAGDTLTVGAVNCNGTEGNLIIVDLYTGSGQHTWAKSGGGTIGVDYWNIQDSIGSPGSTFYAGTHSTDSGNNSGWTFTDAPGDSPVTADLDIRQQILNAVNNDLQAVWNSLANVTADLDARWQLFNALTTDLDARWSIVHNVNADLDLRFGVRAAIANELALHWDLLQHVTGDLDARWDIANLVQNELQAQWQTLNKAEADLDLHWDALAITQSSVTFTWTLNGVAITPITVLRVPAESRHLTVPWERRQLPVPAEQRVLTVH